MRRRTSCATGYTSTGTPHPARSVPSNADSLGVLVYESIANNTAAYTQIKPVHHGMPQVDLTDCIADALAKCGEEGRRKYRWIKPRFWLP